MPGPSSSTLMRANAPSARARDRDGAASATEGNRIVDQIAEHLAEPLVAADDRGARGNRISSAIFTPCGRSGEVVDLDDGLQQMCDIDRLACLAAEFGVEARGVGNIGDQPVDALDVVAHDLHQLRARGIVLGARTSISTALLSDVSGFFNSWATSAAKLSMASMRS